MFYGTMLHVTKLQEAHYMHRLAQWEGQSRKYYYVQRATGHSQWDIPTQPALSVPTPDPTPQQMADPFKQPSGAPATVIAPDGTAVIRKEDGTVEQYEGADRSLLGVCSMATVLILS